MEYPIIQTHGWKTSVSTKNNFKYRYMSRDQLEGI
jgi:hypothetical protein